LDSNIAIITEHGVVVIHENPWLCGLRLVHANEETGLRKWVAGKSGGDLHISKNCCASGRAG
jgi:hypothetical protein